jgi:hypothetical protein
MFSSTDISFISPIYYPTLTSDLRQSLRLGLVLTFLLVLMITHAGTGWFCLVFFISRFLRDVFLRAAIYVCSILFLRLLSVRDSNIKNHRAIICA